MKKGFTIVEIIISISLILLIGVGSFITFNVIKKNNKIKTLESMSSQILTAANLYVETNKDIKDKLFASANGIKIPLKTLENSGLIDFNDVNITDDDYIITMLGTPDEGADHCAETYVAKSWKINNNETIYICEKSNSEIEDLKKQIEELKEQLNGGSGGGGKNALKLESLYADLTYTAKGDNPNNWVYFEVNSNSSNFAYFPSGDNQNLWRIVSISSDNKIKLIYPQAVKSNNSSNYSTTTKPWCDAGADVTESCTFYKLKHSTEGDYYFRYDNNTGFMATEVVESESVAGSKKKALFDSIVNNAWIVTAKYYYSYSAIDMNTVTFNSATSTNMKMGTVNGSELNQSVNLSESWLGKYTHGLGAATVGGTYIHIYNSGVTLKAYERKWKYCRSNYAGDCKYSSDVWYLRTTNYYPVITLSEKVELVEPVCEEGKVKGSKDCPYTLECRDC